MVKKIACMFVIILFFSTIVGSISNIKESLEINNELILKNDYTHTVFIEVATSQNCQKCHNWSGNIYETYNSGDYNFQYVEMIILDHDGEILNDKANDWKSNYAIVDYPTSIMDGDFRRIFGNYPSELPDKLNLCGSRSVNNITAEMTLEWLGDAKFIINISIQNNETTQYNGYIRAPITEIQSRYDTYFGNPYHFGFLDYAFNKEISIAPGEIYTDSISWNGYEHEDNHGNNFGDITKDNIQVTMGVFNNDYNYVDETIMARFKENLPPNEPSDPSPSDGEEDVNIYTDLSWSCSDPDGNNLTYDVYFDTINPPEEKVSTGQTQTTHDPGILNYGTTYYWKIIAFDTYENSTSGPIWYFKTVIYDPPYPPSNPNPTNGATNVGLDEGISWTCSDPGGDPLTYDVYFDTVNPPKEKVSIGQTQTTYNPGILNYETTYYWKIVAYDDEGFSTPGPVWSFTTKNMDNEKPKINIIKPKRGLYFFDMKVFPRLFRFSKIIGPISIEVDATDETSGIEKVEFYINGVLKGNDTSSPYSYTWKRDHLRFIHVFIIKVVAYDKLGNTAIDRMIVRKFL